MRSQNGGQPPEDRTAGQGERAAGAPQAVAAPAPQGADRLPGPLCRPGHLRLHRRGDGRDADEV